MSDSGRCWVGFSDECVGIDWSGPDAWQLIDFLCCDLKRSEPATSRVLLQLHVEKEKSHYVLTKNTTENLYAGDDYYELAYALINEIIYQVIVHNGDGLAIHAAAVHTKAGGVLLPGESGSGKSTFAAWLLSCGCNYLTDELVVLDVESRAIDAFTRPISFKTGSVPVVKAIADFEPSAVIESSSGLMVPHRIFRPNFSQVSPQLSLVLFPKYKRGCTTEITRMSGALGCAQLIECYVNARNIENHGISRLAEIMRATPVYQLTYSSFNGLQEALQGEFPAIFQ